MDPDPASALTARDPQVLELRELQRDHRSRDARGLVIVDDEALVVAALQAGCSVELLLEDQARASEPAPWRALLGAAAVILPAGQEALRALGSTSRVPRVVAAIRRHDEVTDVRSSGGLALAGVSDAGNVGGIVRTAAAFGLTAVTLLDGCADPWGRKALRVAQGAQFGAGLVRTAPSLDVLAQRLDGPLVAYVPHGGGPPEQLPPRATVLLSSLHGGLDRLDRARCDAMVSVPAVGPDALGVSAAGAILAYAIAKSQGRLAPAAVPGGRMAARP